MQTRGGLAPICVVRQLRYLRRFFSQCQEHVGRLTRSEIRRAEKRSAQNSEHRYIVGDKYGELGDVKDLNVTSMFVRTGPEGLISEVLRLGYLADGA
jgi:hypothetical protein